jgi:hypothetical protein
MPNVPFRIAFWALCFALSLTILTGVLADPHQVRLAMRSVPQPPDTSPVLLAETAAPEPPETAVALQEPSAEAAFPGALEPSPSRSGEAVPSVSPEPPAEEPVAAPPIRIASTDPDRPLGVELHIPVPHPTNDLNEKVDGEAGTVESLSERLAEETGASPAADADDEVRQIRQDLMRWQLAEARQELREIQALAERRRQDWLTDEIGRLREEISSVRMAQRLESADEATRASGREPVPAPGVPSDRDRELPAGVTVLEGAQADRWTFHFRSVPVPDVLRVLGDYASWDVVVSPEVEQRDEDLFTGTFRDSDPKQAFLLVLKAHHCTMTHRGQGVLVGRRSE